jgi:hypothetical protein
MLRPLLSIVFFFVFTCCFGQTYRYTFSGNLDSESLVKLEKELIAVKFSDKVTILYKAEKMTGEILLFGTSEVSVGDNNPTQSPVEIKAVLIANGLVPGEFNELKK